MDWLVDSLVFYNENGSLDLIKTMVCCLGFVILLIVLLDVFYIIKSSITSQK